MAKIDTTQSVMKFLELNLSEDGLSFFFSVKKSFGGDEELLYDFLYHYMTIQKGGKKPKDENLYSDFVLYFDRFSRIQGERKILEQIARYVKYFLMLKLEYIENKDFARSISVINAYEAWDVYPFLLEVLDDFENGRIDDAALVGMLNMVEELVFTRLEDNKDMDLSSLGLDINKMLFNSAYTLESRSAG